MTAVTRLALTDFRNYADAVLEAACGKWKAWKAKGIRKHPLSGLRKTL